MPENNAKIDINELNQIATESLIHFNPQRIDYAINEGELSQLEEYGNSPSKELFFASFGISIPTLINAIVARNKITQTNPDYWEFVYNLVPGLVFGILSCFFFFSWQKNRNKKKSIISDIKNRPQFKIPNGAV